MSRVELTHADRVLFPDDGITKGDLFAYYERVAPVLVPHLRDRPFTMKRWREGLAGGSFFQKQAPKGIPDWIPTRQFQTFPREGGSRMVDFPLVNSADALLWMVQMHCIDMNAWYSRVDKPDRPDFVLFDLDPPDDGFALAVRVAHLIREALESLELESYVKTSGADGIHVLVPIARPLLALLQRLALESMKIPSVRTFEDRERNERCACSDRFDAVVDGEEGESCQLFARLIAVHES